MNLLEQQAANRRRTWIVMAVFVTFLLLLGGGFDLFVTGMPLGIFLALAIGTAWSVAGFYGGDRAVLQSTGAVPLERMAAGAADEDERLRLRRFENVAEEMAIAAGLPLPKLYVLPDDDPNAFATGRDPAHASIAVTRGLLAALNREELQAVAAHEMAHVRNYDMRLMTVVAALVGSIVLLADWARRAMWYGRMGRRRAGSGRNAGAANAALLALWVVAIVLAPLAGQALAMAVSRTREYLADASAAELTRNPGALADALEKIEAAIGPTSSIKRGVAHLCIADPLARKIDLREGRWADLMATHPPMPKRIAALRRMAYQRTTA